MTIRWKILITLLCLSIIPMLIMRQNGYIALSNLSEHLTETMRTVLERKTRDTLHVLVDDYARLLRSRGQFIEMAVEAQASEIEKRISGDLVYSREDASSGDGLSPAAPRALSKGYRGRKADEGWTSLSVSHDEQTFIFPSEIDQRSVKDVSDRLASMIPVFRSLKTRQPDAFLWQQTVLETGVNTAFGTAWSAWTLYPAVYEAPDLAEKLLISKWRLTGPTDKRTSWRNPAIDPLTGEVVLGVTALLRNAENRIIGMTAVISPLRNIFHPNPYIRRLSAHTHLHLISLESANGGALQFRVIGSSNYMTADDPDWRYLEENQWRRAADAEQLRRMIDDLSAGGNGVMEIVWNGAAHFAAYGSIDRENAVLLIVPKADVMAEANAMSDYVRLSFEREFRLVGLALLFVIAAVFLMSLMVSRHIGQKIHDLTNTAQRLTAGDFTARVRVRPRGNDELDALGRVFNRMIPKMEERMRMKQGLNLARSVQMSLLPNEPPDVRSLDIAAKIRYCDETGGDFYDFIPLNRNGDASLGIAIGDVSGHGISSALMMATARAFLRCRIRHSGNIGEMIADVNRMVCHDTDETGQFMSLFYIEIMPEKRRLRWVRAGHDAALLYDPHKAAFHELFGEGTALGIECGCEYETYDVETLRNGYVIVVATDGLWEARNPSGEMYGRDRLRSTIRKNCRRPSEEILKEIVASVDDFRHHHPVEDDMTIVVIKVDDPEKRVA